MKLSECKTHNERMAYLLLTEALANDELWKLPLRELAETVLECAVSAMEYLDKDVDFEDVIEDSKIAEINPESPAYPDIMHAIIDDPIEGCKYNTEYGDVIVIPSIQDGKLINSCVDCMFYQAKHDCFRMNCAGIIYKPLNK